jgi:hypothetical protein
VILHPVKALKSFVLPSTSCGLAYQHSLDVVVTAGALRFLLLEQETQLALEIADLLEVLVDAGEPHIGDLVELP